MPVTLITVPVRTPPTERRPKNTTVMLPVSSASVHSRLGVPLHGCTRTERTRPATVVARRGPTSCCMGVRSVGSAAVSTLRERRADMAAAVRRSVGRLGVRRRGVADRGAAEVIGHDGDAAVRHAAERRSDRVRRAVVQQPVPALRVLAPGDQHGQLGAVDRRSSSAAISSAARGTRRSGHSMMSSGNFDKPSSCQASVS